MAVGGPGNLIPPFVKVQIGETCGQDLSDQDMRDIYSRFTANNQPYAELRQKMENLSAVSKGPSRAADLSRVRHFELFTQQKRSFKEWLEGSGGKDNCPQGPSGGSRVPVTVLEGARNTSAALSEGERAAIESPSPTIILDALAIGGGALLVAGLAALAVFAAPEVAVAAGVVLIVGGSLAHSTPEA